MKSKSIVRVVCIILAVIMVFSVFLGAIQIFSANAATTPSANSSGYISGDYVYLRSGAGTNYSSVTLMRQNTKITFVDGKIYNTNWYKIKINSSSQTGYVYKSYVQADSASSGTGSSSGSSSVSANSSGYVSDDYVNLRSGAGTSYSIVTCMRKNTEFTLVDSKIYNSNWYKIKLTSNSKTGYVHKSYVKINTSNTSSGSGSTDSSSSTSGTTGYINADYVNLRSGAGTSYSVVTCMRKSTNVTFISTKLYNSSWYNVKLSDGKTGYVTKQYVTMNKTNSSDSQTSTQPATTQPTSSQSTTAASTTKSSGSDSNVTVKLSNTKETIYIGNQFAITATTTGAGSLKWTSSNSSVATVNSNGVVTAKTAGSATIKATFGNASASCTITVKSGSSINISKTTVPSLSCLKSIYLTSTTSGVKWKSSNTSIATVDGGIVEAKSVGFVTISAYTSSGASTCLIYVAPSDSIQFVYATPNSAPKNSNVTFKAITDTTRTAVKFVVSNGSTSYTVDATSKQKDGNNYIWSGSQKLSNSGEWKIKAYSKTSDTDYKETSGNGEATAFVTNSTDTSTTVTGQRRASDSVIELIANYEGFLSKVTADSITSDPTLGYGRVIYSNDIFYNNLTKNQAYAYLCQTVNSGGYTTKTNQFLTENNIKFNQQQFDALVCFSYNVGSYALYNDSDLQSVLLNTSSGSSGTISAGASGYVNASWVNLRSGAGTGYSILTCMEQNTEFTFVDAKVYNSNWYKIKLSNGTTGYIYRSYASAKTSSGTRDLNNVSQTSFLNNFCAYHHAAGSCYWGLLYRRIDEAEMFFYGDYARDGQNNKKGFDYTCYRNSSISI